MFGNRVQRRCRFIQNQNRPILIQGSCQHQALGLAAGKQHTVQIDLSAKMGIDSVGKFCDGRCQPCLVQAVGDLVQINVFGGLSNTFCDGGIQNGEALKHR